MKIEKTAEEKIFKTPRMEGLKRTFEIEGRKTFVHTVIHSAPSVAVIVRNDKSEIALIKQFRTTTEEWYWELPAGLLFDGESEEDGAIREVSEETGLAVGEAMVLVKGPSILDCSKSDENFGVATATVCGAKSQHLDENEVIDSEIIWMDKAEVYQRLKNQMSEGKPFYEGLYMSGHSVYALISAYFLS